MVRQQLVDREPKHAGRLDRARSTPTGAQPRAAGLEVRGTGAQAAPGLRVAIGGNGHATRGTANGAASGVGMAPRQILATVGFGRQLGRQTGTSVRARIVGRARAVMRRASVRSGGGGRSLPPPPGTPSSLTADQGAARAQARQAVVRSERWPATSGAEEALGRAVSTVPTDGVSDGWLQRTALCAHKIIAILKVRISTTAFPIYRCAAADAQGVGRQPSHIVASYLPLMTLLGA